MWAARQPALAGGALSTGLAAGAHVGVSAAPWIASSQKAGQCPMAPGPCLGRFPLARGAELPSFSGDVPAGPAHHAGLAAPPQTSMTARTDRRLPPFSMQAWNCSKAEAEARRSALAVARDGGTVGACDHRDSCSVWAEQLMRVEAFVASSSGCCDLGAASKAAAAAAAIAGSPPWALRAPQVGGAASLGSCARSAGRGTARPCWAGHLEKLRHLQKLLASSGAISGIARGSASSTSSGGAAASDATSGAFASIAAEADRRACPPAAVLAALAVPASTSEWEHVD